jgi:hypothetical protein
MTYGHLSLVTRPTFQALQAGPQLGDQASGGDTDIVSFIVEGLQFFDSLEERRDIPFHPCREARDIIDVH